MKPLPPGAIPVGNDRFAFKSKRDEARHLRRQRWMRLLRLPLR